MTVDDYEMKVPPRAGAAGAAAAAAARVLDDGGGGNDNNNNCGHHRNKKAAGDEVDSWKELPNLRDGRRENWMTDRAKGSLGTAKLASVFLEEEKGRIYRLRKIKSVLASGQFMGSSNNTTSSTVNKCNANNNNNNRRRRRPYPDMLQNKTHHAATQHHHHHHQHQHHEERTHNIKHGPYPTAITSTGAHTHYAHRHHQAGGGLPSLTPNYPTIPFGFIVNEAAVIPTMRRSSQIEHGDSNNNNKGKQGRRREARESLDNNSSSSGVDPPPSSTWDTNVNFSALLEKEDILDDGAMIVMREDNNTVISLTHDDVTTSGLRCYNHGGGGSSSSRGDRSLDNKAKTNMYSLRLPSPSLGAPSAESGGGGGQTISSGPSAIDLFDQCGLVLGPVIAAEGLVGTTNSSQAIQGDSTRNDTAGGGKAHGMTGDIIAQQSNAAFEEKDPAAAPPAPAAAAEAAMVRPPLVPGGGGITASTGLRGSLRGRHRSPRAHRSPRGHETCVVHSSSSSSNSTKTAQIRSLFAGGGTISALPRGSHVQAPSGGRVSAARGVAVHGDKLLRRDVGKNSAGPNRGAVARLVRSDGTSTTVNASSPGRGASNSASSGKRDRIRRQWNTDKNAVVETDVHVSSPPVKSEKDGELEAAAPAPPAPPSSEQRLASAQARFHKNKGLEALKSEHAEALSILEDVSCPLTAAAKGMTGENVDGEGAVAKDAEVIADQATGKKGFHERTRSAKPNWTLAGYSVPAPCAPAAYSPSGIGIPGAAEDVEADTLSANLPRIGSREEVALRSLYRKWWMKVASGGSPTPCTPDFIELSRMQEGATRGGGAAAAVEGSRQDFSKRDSGTAEEAAGGLLLVVAPSESMGGGGHNGIGGDSSRTFIGGSVTQDTSGSTEDREVGGRRLDQGEAESAAAVVELSMAMEMAAALGTVKTNSRSIGTEEEEARRGSSEKPSESGLQQGSAAGIVAVVDAPGLPSDLQVVSPRTPKAAVNIGGNTPMSSSSPSRSAAVVEAEDQLGNSGNDMQSKTSDVAHVGGGRLEGGGVVRTPLQVERLDSDVGSVSEDGDLQGSEEEGHHGRIYLPDGRFFSTIRREDNDPANNDHDDDEVLSDDDDGSDQGRRACVIQTSTAGRDESSALLARNTDWGVGGHDATIGVGNSSSIPEKGIEAESLDSYADDGWEE